MLNIQEIAMYVVAFLIAVTVHEYAHARAAVSAGDETPKLNGRVSLNPIDHLDPVGTLMFAFTLLYGFGIAWGKPVPVNPYNFRSPRWDQLKVSIWGPVSNIIVAFVLSMIYRFNLVPISGAFQKLFFILILFNLRIAFFNLIPVPPLDGSHILSSLLPINQARTYDLLVARYGILLLILLIFTGIAGMITNVPTNLFIRLFLGT
ncbi:MAG: site-2 protease family protein [Armatimonadetes bacterium]|nr:site-2 protease family protein [Armatimonadota bacterium]